MKAPARAALENGWRRTPISSIDKMIKQTDPGSRRNMVYILADLFGDLCSFSPTTSSRNGSNVRLPFSQLHSLSRCSGDIGLIGLAVMVRSDISETFVYSSVAGPKSHPQHER